MKLGQGGSYDGQKADVWSCGVALYCMLFATYPFKQAEPEKKGKKKTVRTLFERYVALGGRREGGRGSSSHGMFKR